MDGWIMMEETKPVMMVMMDEQEYEYDKKDEYIMKMKIGVETMMMIRMNKIVDG